MLITRIAVIGLLASCGLFFAQVARAGDATNRESQISGPEKLKVLERKAADRDSLVKKCEQLEASLGETISLNSRDAHKGQEFLRPKRSGRLVDLERKAADHDRLAAEMAGTDLIMVDLAEQLNMAKAQVKEMQDQVEKMQKEIDEMKANRDKSAETEKALRNTVDELLLGNFEYYEVKKGDTLASIAAQPTLYGDESKKEWLRQANGKLVKDLDNLTPNEVLVIPRFRPSGRFEF